MGEAIGQVLTYAIGVMISPIPIIAVVLMLWTPRARSNGPAFVVGWLIGLAVVGTIVLALSGGADASEGGSPADWVSVLKLGAGVLLFVLAIKSWRGRPRNHEDATLPSWMETVDHFTPQRSFAMAIGLSAINPKNLILTVGAAAAIAQTGVGAGEQAVALAVFVVIATLGAAIPVGVYFLKGDRAAEVLDELKTWMARNNGAIMAVICIVIGAKLIGDGISGLSG